jgi:hypothetical protein
VVIPWFDAGRLCLLKIRPADAWRAAFPDEDRRPPKYIQAFADGAALYPSTAAIRTGDPLVIVEGELDCVLLEQEIGHLAAVVTLGSASARPEGRTLLAMMASPRWFVATDADKAGDDAVAKWPARAVRVRPPGDAKDWTEIHAGGLNRLRYLWPGYLCGFKWPRDGNDTFKSVIRSYPIESG